MIPFENQVNSSKVWVYISDNRISELQKNIINTFTAEFLSSWKSHGELVQGSVSVVDDYFLLICANVSDGNLCGRAVDANVRFVKELQDHTGLSLLNRLTVAYRNSENHIMISSYGELKTLIDNNDVASIKSVFNNRVLTKEEFISSFEQPVDTCWLN
jgi:Leucine-rich repeat (LRR) protein